MPRRSRPRTAKSTRAPTSHRIPPKPASWFCERGTCRFCGEPIIENGKVNTRKHWHQACANTWKVMNNPSDARAFVLSRERYTCEACHEFDRFGAFEVDHVKPLFEAKGDPSYWHPDNLMLLCIPCHKVKTRQDMIRFRALDILSNRDTLGESATETPDDQDPHHPDQAPR